VAEPRRMLFVDFACKEHAALLEPISAISKLHGIGVERLEFVGLEQLAAHLAKVKRNYEIIYIAAHGNEDGVAKTANRDRFVRWAELAETICQSQGVAPDTTIYLGCCRGGAKRTALILMARCPTIHWVAGVGCEFSTDQVSTAFHVFLHNKDKGNDPDGIRHSVGAAIGNKFMLHSRYELDAEIIQVMKEIFGVVPNQTHLPEAYFLKGELQVVVKEAAE
jgi:hypothetical protein